jgi:hypothetical protein
MKQNENKFQETKIMKEKHKNGKMKRESQRKGQKDENHGETEEK